MNRAILPALILCSSFLREGRADRTDDAIREGRFEPGFEAAIRSDELLSTGGGAKVVVHDEKRYFIAVGVTAVFPASPRERLRRLTVGEAKALREAAEFVEETRVRAKTEMTEGTRITKTQESERATSVKTIDERILTQVEAVLAQPPRVGTWQNAEGSLFFYAVGKVLEEPAEPQRDRAKGANAP